MSKWWTGGVVLVALAGCGKKAAPARSATRSLNGPAPQVVAMPCVSRRSFAPHGIP